MKTRIMALAIVAALSLGMAGTALAGHHHHDRHHHDRRVVYYREVYRPIYRTAPVVVYNDAYDYPSYGYYGYPGYYGGYGYGGYGGGLSIAFGRGGYYHHHHHHHH